MKYCQLLHELASKGMVECDVFLLLTADYKTICERNTTRNHVLEGIWLDEATISMQRRVLEEMIREMVGSIGIKGVKKEILNTTQLSKLEVLSRFNSITNDLVIEGEEI